MRNLIKFDLIFQYVYTRTYTCAHYIGTCVVYASIDRPLFVEYQTMKKKLYTKKIQLARFTCIFYTYAYENLLESTSFKFKLCKLKIKLKYYK